MALNLVQGACSPCLFTRPTAPIVPLTPLSISCCAAPTQCAPSSLSTVNRRSGNYHPSVWDFEVIQSLQNGFKDDVMHKRRAKNLEEGVRNKLNLEEEANDQLAQLELIDALQRLGIGYLYEKEIKKILDKISATCSSNSHNNNSNNPADSTKLVGLHAVALRFRLLRQHGYHISSKDAFEVFKDDNQGHFKESLCEDIEGMLSLYEASHFAVEGLRDDDILDEAKTFTTKHLKDKMMNGLITDPKLAKLVSQSLEIPLHWRMQRFEARWYIEACSEGREDNNNISPDVIELAKLNYNMVQATHQEDLKELSRWWRDLGLHSHPKLSFARDRLVEHFVWGIGIISDPQYSYCWKEIAKVISFVTTIDDVYDVYGYLDELELFTDAVQRWDIKAMDQLPSYMKICFLALYNTVNQMAYITLKERDLDILHYLKKAWADLCKAGLVVAKWYYNKYTPTLEEYLENAWISISGPLILSHAYFLVKQEITKEGLESLERYADLIRWSSIIFRLSDDLGTATGELERGDVPKSIQCYMHETGCSEEVAREHIKHLIEETWKKLNKERVNYSLYSKPFIGAAVNIPRTSQFMYQFGDGHGVSYGETKNRVVSLLVEPMPLVE